MAAASAIVGTSETEREWVRKLGKDTKGMTIPASCPYREVATPAAIPANAKLWATRIGSKAYVIWPLSRLAVTGEPNSWRWGRLHTISLRSIFDSFSIPTYNAPPQAAPGGLFTVNVASPRRVIPADGKPWDFQFRSGPSVRFVVEASAEGLRMNYQLPGGTDLHRESPFYNNLLPSWLENKPVEFLFGPGAVTSPAVELEVTPAP